MYESLFEVGVELLGVVLYAAGSLLLMGVGVVAEYDGLQSAASGDLTLGVWFAFMGLLAFTAGTKLGYEKILQPRLS